MRMTILAGGLLLAVAAAVRAQDAPKAERPEVRVGDSVTVFFDWTQELVAPTVK